MKKFLIRFFVALLALILIVLLLNVRFERKKRQEFNERIFPSAEPAADNGFCAFYLFAAPQEEDIFSAASLDRLRERYSMARNGKLSDEVERTEYNQAIPLQKPGRRLMSILEKCPLSDWPQGFLNHKEQILQFHEKARFMYERYRRLLTMPEVRDFSFPGLYFPYLNIFLLEDCADFWVAKQMIAAAGGKYTEAVLGLLQNIAFGSKMLRYSRRWSINRLALRIMQYSVAALTILMENPQSPEEACSLVLNNLPPLSYSGMGLEASLAYTPAEFSLFLEAIDRERDLRPLFRGSLRQYSYLYFSFEGLLGRGKRHVWMVPIIKIFLHKGSTTRIYTEYFRRMVELASMAPYQWQTHTDALRVGGTRTSFWWLRNPIGKMALQAWLPSPEQLLSEILATYTVKAQIDLVRLAAELRMSRMPKGSLSAMVPSPASYRTVDPFSGRPYGVDDSEGMVFSRGIAETLRRLGLKSSDLPSIPPLRVRIPRMEGSK